MKTYSAKPADVQRDWFLVDAEEKTLGRLASEISPARQAQGRVHPARRHR